MVRKTVHSRFDSGFLANVDGIVKNVKLHNSQNIRLTPKLNQYYAKDYAPKNEYEEGTRHELIGLKPNKTELPPVGAFKLPVPSSVVQTSNNVEDIEVDQEIADLKTYEQPTQVAIVETKPITLLPKVAAPPAKSWEAGGKRKSKFSQFLEENPVKEVTPEVQEHKSSGKFAAFLNKNVETEEEDREEVESVASTHSNVHKMEVEDDLDSEDEDEKDEELIVVPQVREPIRRVPEINRARSVKEAPARKAIGKKQAPSLDQEGVVLMIQNWFNAIVLFLLTVFNFFKDLILGKNELRVTKEKTRSRGRPRSGRRSDGNKILRLR